MKVLVGCEYSGVVRDAFISRGHDAMSCDLLPTDTPGPHYQGDVFDKLAETWDLIIIHPPCTALTVAGNRHYGRTSDRYGERLAAAAWTEKLWDTCNNVSPRVCLENPVGVLNSLTNLPKPSYVHPWQFGHPEQKKTGLFLSGLDPLIPTDDVYDHMMTLPAKDRERIWRMPPSEDRWKLRSTTFQGFADAMADQWGRA